MRAALSISAFFTLGAVIAAGLTSPPALAQSGTGVAIYRANCVGCHKLPDPEVPKRTRAQWDSVLTRMVKKRGASLNQQEYAQVLDYLDSFNLTRQTRRAIQWLDTPARSHKVALAPRDAGHTPSNWASASSGEADIPWTVGAEGAACYLAPARAAGEGLYPILIDNTGVVQDGTVTTRLKIASGSGSVGAGVVFGWDASQGYYGVRVSPRDVVLYEYQAGTRSLLARKPMAVPLKAWHALAVSLDGKEVKVSFDARPLPELSRTLPNYKGGRVGAQTQGDTVAYFNGWQLDVR